MHKLGIRPRSFVVLGEEARLEAAAGVLVGGGYERLGHGQIAAAELALLGVPVRTLEPWREALAQLAPQSWLFAGALSSAAREQAAQYPLRVVDYMESEELALFNAVPTAEGALAILLGATTGTLWRAEVILVGYGRIARVLAPRLRALGARVTVAARDPKARMQAQTMGDEAADIVCLPQLAAHAAIVINTVPHPVVDATVRAALPDGAFVLELAGSPGGGDLAAAQRLGVRVQCAPGLPGIYAPVAAGEAIGRTVLAFMRHTQPM